MEFLNSVVSRTPEFKRLLQAVKGRNFPLEASGLSSIHKALVISGLISETKQKAVLITPGESDAFAIGEDLKALGVKVRYLPTRDYSIGRVAATSKEYEHLRIDTLSKLLDGDFELLALSAKAAIQYTLPPEVLRDNTISLKEGDEIDLNRICSRLSAAGYVRCEQVEGRGQFAVRGGILDIFAVNRELPNRIELWGDEIDTICEFEVETQRRTEKVSELLISPASEVVCESEKLAQILENYSVQNKKLSQNQKKELLKDLEKARASESVALDRYIRLIYKDSTVFDYLKDAFIITSELVGVLDSLKSSAVINNEDVKTYLEEGFLSSATAKLYLDDSELMNICSKGILLDSFLPSSVPFNIKELLTFDYKRNSAWNKDIEVLKEDISYILSKGGLAVIAAGGVKAAELLCGDLENAGINAAFMPKIKGLPVRGAVVTVGGLSSGFEIPSEKFIFVTHKHIFGESRQKRAKKRNKNSYNSLEELRAGEYVVHASHGIGIFEGINRITNKGVTKDYIKIKYAKGDILYVPVTQLDLVSKYIGSSEEHQIRLNRLGTQEWHNTRKRVKKAVKDMAKKLTELYSKRMSSKGYAFSSDTDLQSDFERRFEYEETEDQLRSVNEIKNDMERAVPMDRLLCGDVGFGKTEVALRAAFKCVAEGKQCAVLVPTTILALQHYNTIIKRFGDMPVTVKMLSRFVSKKEQEKTVRELKRGNVDLIVGTHRIISKDIVFKDLGLVIIDEEQRFGVAHKERFKEEYPFVDVLTLSATPIPRTLNMAMSGLRDLSSIDEAPGDRHPVQTYVLEHNNGVIRDAISKELRRGGQVYYLHNRVNSIERVAFGLKEAFPTANVAVAHGKMSEDELSLVWKRLLEQEIDILVCTTIIETGVDVPNANTLIIEDADCFGLSQLHQLRGRVGRSPRRAYAYFCFRQGKGLSETATKRLEAIKEYTEFGSGFKIAMRDLEIRGAGNILGGEQHGNMEAVGYDMYLKLLNDAMNEEKGIKKEEERTECLVDLNISAHIPEGYIESLPARLGIYRRIAEINSTEDAEDVIDELCDRFGEPPKAVIGLIDIALFRSRAAANGIYEITSLGDALCLKTNEIKEEQMQRLCDGLKDRVTLNVSDKPYYSVKLKKGQNLANALLEISEIL
ncbi:MAG: transcription-repair coupling factor [Clostridia bacterium]|nr:transcription-repair coupling factor [Clostridia bacterium]